MTAEMSAACDALKANAQREGAYIRSPLVVVVQARNPCEPTRVNLYVPRDGYSMVNNVKSSGSITRIGVEFRACVAFLSEGLTHARSCPTRFAADLDRDQLDLLRLAEARSSASGIADA